MTPEEKLKFYISEIENSVSKQDFETAFEEVIKVIESLKATNLKEFEAIHAFTKDFSAKLKKDAGMDLADIRKECKKMMDSMMKENSATMNFMRDKSRSIRNGKDGKDGISPKISDIVPMVLAQIPEDPEETALEVRDKLETLEGNERLDKSAIKGIEGIEENIKELQIRPAGKGGGGKGFMLYVDGSKKLLTANTLNLIAGTGITLTYAHASGRNDITITSGSGGGILAATGTVNGTNTLFTFISAPTQLIVDGVPKQKTQSDGTVNWTGTTSVTLAVAPNFDIYGIL